ncbi:MAG TPA: hypothetical protein VFG23_14835 [Polyangia bacterium]|nr:hypothetical protein [Polyangia bacterium]
MLSKAACNHETIAQRVVVFLPVLCLAGISCAQGRMLPAASAHTIPGAPEAAAAEVEGVRVSAEGDDWDASPADLATRLTPVKVRIVNHSGSPARIEYQQFTLVGGHGHVYRAIPIVALDHATPVAGNGTIDPIYAASNFFVAPRYHDVYPTLEPWPHPLVRDDASSDQQDQRWGRGLPTRVMRRMGLPEGVLADGGEISGFLYFEDATKRESRLTFRAEIDNEQQGDQLAEIKIPFRVQ